MKLMILAALAVGALVLLGFGVAALSGDDGPASREGNTSAETSPRPQPGHPADRSVSLDAARALIRDCKVRSTLSLHSGVFSLELKSGDLVRVPKSSEDAIYAEIQTAHPRCGNVIVAME